MTINTEVCDLYEGIAWQCSALLAAQLAGAMAAAARVASHSVSCLLFAGAWTTSGSAWTTHLAERAQLPERRSRLACRSHLSSFVVIVAVG